MICAYVSCDVDAEKECETGSGETKQFCEEHYTDAIRAKYLL